MLLPALRLPANLSQSIRRSQRIAFFPCAVAANCRQTTSPYGSYPTTSSILQPEQDWFCLILEIPHFRADYPISVCLSRTSTYISQRYTVFYGAPPVLGGRGNSGAQAVLSSPALITSDSLGTRLRDNLLHLCRICGQRFARDRMRVTHWTRNYADIDWRHR